MGPVYWTQLIRHGGKHFMYWAIVPASFCFYFVIIYVLIFWTGQGLNYVALAGLELFCRSYWLELIILLPLLPQFWESPCSPKWDALSLLWKGITFTNFPAWIEHNREVWPWLSLRTCLFPDWLLRVNYLFLIPTTNWWINEPRGLYL